MNGASPSHELGHILTDDVEFNEISDEVSQVAPPPPDLPRKTIC